MADAVTLFKSLPNHPPSFPSQVIPRILELEEFDAVDFPEVEHGVGVTGDETRPLRILVAHLSSRSGHQNVAFVEPLKTGGRNKKLLNKHALIIFCCFFLMQDLPSEDFIEDSVLIKVIAAC